MPPRPRAHIRTHISRAQKRVRPVKPAPGEFVLNVPAPRGKTKTLNPRAIERMMPVLLHTLSEWARTLPKKQGAHSYIVVRARNGLIVPDVRRTKAFPLKQGLRVVVPVEVRPLIHLFDEFARYSNKIDHQRKQIRAWNAGARLEGIMNGRSLAGLILMRGKKERPSRAVQDVRHYLNGALKFVRDPDLFAILLSRIKNKTAALNVLKEFASHMSAPKFARAQILLAHYQKNPFHIPKVSKSIPYFVRKRQTREEGVVAYDFFPPDVKDETPF